MTTKVHKAIDECHELNIAHQEKKKHFFEIQLKFYFLWEAYDT